jgi:DNA-binding NtrC family response regulator
MAWLRGPGKEWLSMPQWLLVTEDATGAAAVPERAGRPAAVWGYAAALDQLDAEPGGPVVAFVGAPEEVEPALRLARTLHLLASRRPLFVVATPAACHADRLRALEPYATQFFLWPQDEAALKARLGRDRAPPAEASDAATRIARRLAAWTPSLTALAEKLALAAEHEVTVLLTGETGTGKTFLARLLHDFSPRREERFLTVPCGALSPNLVESEFFGHVKGAFTGADRPKVGKFAAAGKGTILLDEVDALSIEQQANLLRVVETGEYEPVGGTETHRSACRVVAASNRDLAAEVAAGRFRQDLFYRFNVMSFHLPPLRERPHDLPRLVRGLAARYSAKFRKDLDAVSPEAMTVLAAYPWPGNLRELENAVQSAVLVSAGPTLLPRHLPEPLRHAVQRAAHPEAPETLTFNREAAERASILKALANHANRRTDAARELGVSRVTLYKKMKKYGLLAGGLAVAG